MIELYYDSYSVAYFIVSQDMGSKTGLAFLGTLYDSDYEFLHPVYKGKKKDFISDVLYWADYLMDKETLDKEFPIVEKDFKATGRKFIRESFMSDYPEFDLYFMMLRLRIRYINDIKYVRIKLRTLLKHFGYKRRTDKIISHIRDCIMFYHIQPYMKGEKECDIKDISLDDMITFRVL